MVRMVGVVLGMLFTLRERIPAADSRLHRSLSDERRGAVQGIADAEEDLLDAVRR